MYIRNLRKPSANKNIFKFSSFKNAGTIMCESSLEFDACFHLEYSSSIISFESQPIGIEYQMNGKIRRYTPDFKIVKDTGEIEFIEIKPSKKLTSLVFREAFECKRSAYKMKGFKLLLVTDKQIRSTPLLDNLKVINRYSSSSLSDVHDLALKHIRACKSLSISELALKLGLIIGDCIAACALLINRGSVHTDLEGGLLCEHSLMMEA